MSKVATAAPLNLNEIVTRRPRVQGVGIVKNVLSGDTFIIEGSAANGTPQEKRLTLSGISAPRLGFGKKSTDEPCAFAAREHLSNLILRKVVEFVLPNADVNQADSDSDGSKTEFAEVTVDGINVAEAMVSSGYATVNQIKPRDDGKEVRISPEREQLQALQAKAKQQKLGIHNTAKASKAIRELNWEPDTIAILNRFKNKTIQGYVDRVLDGSTYRIEIPSDDLKHQVITFNLAGVTAPRSGNGKDQQAEPFGVEAQAFADSRIGNKKINFTILGIDTRGQFYGTVVHKQHGNLAILLLSQGLVQYTPWSALLTGEEELYKSTALACRNGIYATTPYTPAQRDAYDAIVLQIVSGDCVLVQKADDNTEHRVYLSSVIAPRVIGGKFQPFAFESREFLRRSLIGKKVRVEVDAVVTPVAKAKDTATASDAIPDDDDNTTTDGDDAAAVTSPSNNTRPPRVYVSMFKGKYNIANELIAIGLADVTPLFKDTEPSLYYGELCLAEVKAKTEKKNKHGNKKPATQIIDLSPQPVDKEKDNAKDVKSANRSNNERAQHTFDTMQRNGQTLAVLDSVYSPTRFRIFVPTLNAYMTITLGGVATPAVEKGEERPQPVKDGIKLLRKYIQHDIAIEPISISRTSFVANVFHKESGENLAVTLTRKGYVTLSTVGVDRNKHKQALYDAENAAKKERLGLWVDYDEEKERLAQEAARQEAAESLGVGIYQVEGVSYINVRVTDVADPVHFYINNIDNKNVTTVQEQMAAFNPEDHPVTDAFNPQVGEIVAGLFEDDNQWYRARIERHRKSNSTYDVQFIDYGNITTVPAASIRPLPADLLKIKPLARPCQLSGTKAPLLTNEHYEGGANVFAMITVDKTFVARIDHTEHGQNGILHLTLFPANYHEESTDKTKALSINQELVREGYIRIDPRPPHNVKAIISELIPHEDHARYHRNKIYEYGDYTSDTEADF